MRTENNTILIITIIINPVLSKSPISYMTTCLYEFITHYDYLKDEVRCSKSGSGYGPSYNIEEFEGSSFLDDF